MNEIEMEVIKLINKFEIVISKFEEGTAQHTLVRNRIRALNTALVLMKEDYDGAIATKELKESLIVIESIISKSSKAVEKLKETSVQARNLKSIITAMNSVKSIYLEEISEKSVTKSISIFEKGCNC